PTSQAMASRPPIPRPYLLVFFCDPLSYSPSCQEMQRAGLFMVEIDGAQPYCLVELAFGRDARLQEAGCAHDRPLVLEEQDPQAHAHGSLALPDLLPCLDLAYVVPKPFRSLVDLEGRSVLRG